MNTMVIKNLVLSGAELRGITYIGVIRAIEDLSIYDSIENILGVSSGAIFAMTLVLGLSSIQLEKIIMSISLEQLFNFKTDDILSIAETFGIDDGEKITRIFKVLFYYWNCCVGSYWNHIVSYNFFYIYFF